MWPGALHAGKRDCCAAYTTTSATTLLETYLKSFWQPETHGRTRMRVHACNHTHHRKHWLKISGHRMSTLRLFCFGAGRGCCSDRRQFGALNPPVSTSSMPADVNDLHVVAVYICTRLLYILPIRTAASTKQCGKEPHTTWLLRVGHHKKQHDERCLTANFT